MSRFAWKIEYFYFDLHSIFYSEKKNQMIILKEFLFQMFSDLVNSVMVILGLLSRPVNQLVSTLAKASKQLIYGP